MIFSKKNNNESSIRSSPFYEIQKELAQLSEDIDERKEKYEILKKKLKDNVTSHGTEQSTNEARRLNESLGIMWLLECSKISEICGHFAIIHRLIDFL